MSYLRRPATLAAVAWLAFLTLVGTFCNNVPQLPIDARTGSHVAGAALGFPAWGALVEPISALGHIMAGAPDMRVAIVSTLIWIVLAMLAAAWILRMPLRQGLRIVAAGMLLYLVYLCFVLLVPMPDWKLESRDPGTIVADLHSHSLNSHDGLVTPTHSLMIHQEHGFDVVGFTEHGNPVGAAAAAGFGGHGLPDTIPGIEVQAPIGAFLLAIGLKPGRPILTVLHNHADTLHFIHQVHDIHHGVVIALNFRLTPAKVRQLAADGIDGFEIANAGHPSLSGTLRRALLAEQKEHGLILISSSDWHGWGGFFHTWTLIRPQASEIGATQAETVLNVLRRHDYRRIIPATADAMGTPSLARAAFAPFAEAWRYARELSPLRLAAWWGWIVALLIAGRALEGRGFAPGRIFLGTTLSIFAGGLLFQGASMLVAAQQMHPANAFATRIALTGIGVGLSAALAALLNLRRARSGRQAVIPTYARAAPVSSGEST